MRYLTHMRKVENSKRPINLSGRTSRPGAPTNFDSAAWTETRKTNLLGRHGIKQMQKQP